MWYWYFSGVISVLFIQSIILNVGLMTGTIKWNKRKPVTVTRLYDQDESGQIRRSA